MIVGWLSQPRPEIGRMIRVEEHDRGHDDLPARFDLVDQGARRQGTGRAINLHRAAIVIGNRLDKKNIHIRKCGMKIINIRVPHLVNLLWWNSCRIEF